MAATLAAAAGIAGCGGSGSGSSQPSSAKQTLKLITWVNPPTVDAFKKIDAEFHKQYPNITVDLGTAASITGPYATMLQTSVDSNSADIVTDYPPVQPLPLHATKQNMSLWQYWTTQNVFAPLDGNQFVNNYSAQNLASETYKGKVYGIVSGSYQEGVFYNKAIFSKYHLAVPTTYNQFISELKTLKSHGVTPLFDGLGGGVGGSYLQFMFNELMAEDWAPNVPGQALATDLEKGSVKWTDPDFVKAMTEEKTIAQYLEPNYTGVPWQSMPGDFAKGDSAMLLDGSWDMPAVQKANPKIKVGFFPLPGSNTAADNQAYNSANLTFSVMKNSAHKAAAMKWLSFFSEPKIYAQYVKMTGISPSEKTGSYSGFTASAMGKWFGKGVNGALVYPTLASTQGYWDQQNNWNTVQLDVVQGSKTPLQAAQLYQSDWKTS